MKTLILNGSPRHGGDTDALVKLLERKLGGDVLNIDCYNNDIAPCSDCRFCRNHPDCKIKDGMQKVYDYLRDCDNVIIASPVFFEELSGGLLNVASRFQVYCSAMIFRKEVPPLTPKRGGVILTAGGSGGTTRAYYTACCILKSIGVSGDISCVGSTHTDIMPAKTDKAAISDITALANILKN